MSVFAKLMGTSSIALASFLSFKTFNAEGNTAENIKVVTKSGICIMIPHNKSGVKGLVSFHQKGYSAPTQIVANITGLNPNSNHGLHIHEFGDLTNGCVTAGPHFNPDNQQHGGPFDKVRHVGDFGNIKTDEKGNGFMAMDDEQITLFGEKSIIGRSVVVHEKEDDLGRGENEESKKTGNSGARLACGIIGLTDKFKNLPPA